MRAKRVILEKGTHTDAAEAEADDVCREGLEAAEDTADDSSCKMHACSVLTFKSTYRVCLVEAEVVVVAHRTHAEPMSVQQSLALLHTASYNTAAMLASAILVVLDLECTCTLSFEEDA